MLFSCNFVSAEIINLSGGMDSKPTETNDKSAENIIKILQDELKPLQDIGFGSQALGSQGISYAAAYITPDKKFGYMHVPVNHVTGNGNIVVSSDPIGGGKWGFGSMPTGTWQNRNLLNQAKKHFESDAMRNTLKNFKDSDVKNAYVQKNLNNDEKFVATTLYIRWAFDVKQQTGVSMVQECANRNSKYNPYAPIFDADANGGGPYFATGDWLGNNPGIVDVMRDTNNYNGYNNSARKQIYNESGKRLTSYRSIFGSSSPDRLFMTKDLKTDGVSTISNKNGVFSKFAEYRRYLSPGEGTPKYEVAIPVEIVNVSERKVTPNLAPKVTVDGDVKYKDGVPDEYIFDVEVTKRNATYNYSGRDKSEYEFKKSLDGKPQMRDVQEPGDNQIDAWHENMKAELVLRDNHGLPLLEEPIKLNTNGKQRIIVKASDLKYVEVDHINATVDVTFTSGIRYLANKTDYDMKYKYNSNDTSLKTLGQIKDYIDSSVKNGGGYKQSLYTSLEKQYTAANPRLEKTFLTNRDANKNIKAETNLWIIPEGGDTQAPDVDVSVDPPNTLTKVEGGSFDINISAEYDAKDPNLTVTGGKEYEVENEHDLPPGEVGEHLWVDDFKIDKITVTAEDGSLIFEGDYGDDNFEITEDTFGKIAIIVRDQEANPYQIGEAKVKVEYSYNRYHRKWTKTPSEEYTLVDGVVVPNSWNIKASTDSTPQKGEAFGTFNIYSLSGVTG